MATQFIYPPKKHLNTHAHSIRVLTFKWVGSPLCLLSIILSKIMQNRIQIVNN